MLLERYLHANKGKPMKLINKLAVLFVIALMPQFTSAALLTFDDLPAPNPYGQGGAIPTGYGGLNWNNNLGPAGQGAAYYNTNVLRLWAYYKGVVSGPQAAYTFNSFGVNDIEMWGPAFTFNSAWFTAAVGPNQTVNVSFYNGGTRVHAQTIAVTYAVPQLFTFNVTNVTKVTIDPGNYQVIIDDIMINAARMGPLDSDRDGVPDDMDAFPHSRDVGANVAIDGCDTGVPSLLFPDGTTLSDLIYQIAAEAENHGRFVSGVAQLKNQLRKDSLLTAAQASAIEKGAALSSLP
jgi:hypothetical protein